MSQKVINRGSAVDDGTGDTLRDGAGKINDNFTELYSNYNFGKLVVNGQSNVTATILADTLTLAAGNNVIITTNATSRTLTLNVELNARDANGDLILGDPGTGNASIRIPNANNDTLDIKNPDGEIVIGDNGNTGIVVPTDGDPITIGGNNGISVPPDGNSNGEPIQIGTPNTGITIPAANSGDPIEIGSNTGLQLNNLSANMVVYTANTKELAVSSNLYFNGTHLTINNNHAFFQLSDFGGTPGESVGDHAVGIRWKDSGVIGDAATENYAYIRGYYGSQTMESNSGILELAVGSPLTGERGYSGDKNAVAITYSGHVSIATDPGPYSDSHKLSLGRGGMLIETYVATDQEQIFQAWGTSKGNQIYQDAGGYELAQLGNQGNTYWLGHGGVLNDPFEPGQRCITWDTGCHVEVGNGNNNIVVPGPGSGDPMELGGNNGIQIPPEGSPLPTVIGGPGGGAGNGGGSGGGGISVPGPGSNDPVQIGHPDNGIKVPPDGSADPITIGGNNGIVVPAPGNTSPVTINGEPVLTEITVQLQNNLTGNGTSNSSGIVVIQGSYIDTIYNGGNTGSSITPDRNNGTVLKYTANASFTLNTPSNVSNGHNFTIILTQDAVGSRVMTANSNYKFAEGFKTLSTSANAIDMLNVFYDGTYYYVTLTTGYA